jgi:diguanylate cyclase (GGDEF)-like protein/PAS domain S-box-containing protein
MKGNSARLMPAIDRELREADERAARRKNERRFQSLIEKSSDIITVVSVDGTILYESPSVERLLGPGSHGLTGTRLQDHIHPDDHELVCNALLAPPGEGQPFEFRVPARDGGWRTLEATINHLLDDPNVGGIVLNCRDITARKQDEQTIRHLAYFDALTGLANRTLFNDRLAQALAHSKRRGARGLAIMFLDLDRFKAINDTLGHGAGDELLRLLATRLGTTLREEDTVARLGGDEFLFLFPDVDDVEDAARIAQKLLAVFQQPFTLGDHEYHVTGSIGISMFPLDGGDAESILRNADTALHRAKMQGGNRYQLYAPAMNALAVKSLILENSLRRAIDRNELKLHYQPMRNLATGGTVAVEALMRWQHPDLNLISPAEFIPIAEETGLIVPMTRWALRTACAQMKNWQREGVPLQSVSVNVSAYHFQDMNLPAMLDEILRAEQLDGRHLCVELTESVMMDDAEASIATLQELKKLGVKISIDDFGTGFSSLSYLRRLPIDTLKIDQSFVKRISNDSEDAAIVMLIISMAHTLNLGVVAEGVETESQMEFLRANGCNIIQGFLISRPLPVEEITRFLSLSSRA